MTPQPLRITFARLCRDTRTALDVTQAELARSVGVSRAHVSAIEAGRANPSLDLIDRVAEALGLGLGFAVRDPIILGGGRQRDAAHAWCSGYTERRLRGAGWETAREVPLVHGRTHGWVDVIAYDRRSGTLLIIEVKTWIDDLGAVERQLNWYERSAMRLAHRYGWYPRRVLTWLVVLATDAVDASIRANRDVIDRAFPMRAMTMGQVAAGSDPGRGGRGIALIDPASRRQHWLIRSRSDGRRSPAPYRDYADAMRRREAAAAGRRRTAEEAAGRCGGAVNRPAQGHAGC